MSGAARSAFIKMPKNWRGQLQPGHYVLRAGQWVISSQAKPLHARHGTGPMIIRDVPEHRNMVTGEMVTSRSRHRQILKENGCFEVGNEPIKQRPRAVADRAGIREAIKRTKAELNVTGVNIRG